MNNAFMSALTEREKCAYIKYLERGNFCSEELIRVDEEYLDILDEKVLNKFGIIVDREYLPSELDRIREEMRYLFTVADNGELMEDMIGHTLLYRVSKDSVELVEHEHINKGKLFPGEYVINNQESLEETVRIALESEDEVILDSLEESGSNYSYELVAIQMLLMKGKRNFSYRNEVAFVRQRNFWERLVVGDDLILTEKIKMFNTLPKVLAVRNSGSMSVITDKFYSVKGELFLDIETLETMEKLHTWHNLDDHLDVARYFVENKVKFKRALFEMESKLKKGDFLRINEVAVVKIDGRLYLYVYRLYRRVVFVNLFPEDGTMSKQVEEDLEDINGYPLLFFTEDTEYTIEYPGADLIVKYCKLYLNRVREKYSHNSLLGMEKKEYGDERDEVLKNLLAPSSALSTKVVWGMRKLGGDVRSLRDSESPVFNIYGDKILNEIYLGGE